MMVQRLGQNMENRSNESANCSVENKCFKRVKRVVLVPLSYVLLF